MKSKNITAVISAKIHFMWKQVIVNEKIVQRNGCCEWRRSFIISRVTNYLISTSSLRTRDLIVKKREVQGMNIKKTYMKTASCLKQEKVIQVKQILFCWEGQDHSLFLILWQKMRCSNVANRSRSTEKEHDVKKNHGNIIKKNWLSWRNKKAFWQEFLLLTNNIYVFHVKSIA